VLFALAASANAQQTSPPRPSMTLSEAFKLALAESERVRVAEREVDAADIRWTQAWTELGPTASINGNGGYISRETFNLKGVSIGGSGALNLPLFRKSFFDAREGGELAKKSAEAALVRTREQLMRDVVVAFIGVMRARQQIELFKSAVTRADAQQKAASQRVKAGGALRTAELLAQIDLRRAQIQLNVAERDARSAEVAFQTLVGEPPPSALTLPPTPKAPAMEEAMKLREERADLKALRLLTMQSRALEAAARGRRLWPRLDARAQLDVGTLLAAGDLGGTTTDWTVLGILTFPLFETGNEYIEIALQENATRALELQEKLLLELSGDDVGRALVRVAAEGRAAVLAEAQVKDALENYQLVAAQFRLGAITFIDVATAQAVLTEAENLRVVAIYDREIAHYELLFLAGALTLE
jgi:outer membrane protein TolC